MTDPELEVVWDGACGPLTGPYPMHTSPTFAERDRTKQARRYVGSGRGKAHAPYAAEVKRQARALARSGRSTREAAEIMGIKVDTLRGWLAVQR